MSTRDLATNSKKALDKADRIISFTSDTLIKSYKTALIDVRSKLADLYSRFLTLEEPTKAQLTQFMRLSNIEKEIVSIMKPYLSANEALLKDMSVLGVDTGFFNNAWAVDQATGVSQSWGMIDDVSVRAAAGIGGDSGELKGLLTAKEIKQHQKVLEDAFTNYNKDTAKWISQDIRQGIIQGESVPKIAKRLRDSAITKSYNSAMVIARTETLRAMGIGNQVAYDQARDAGVQIIETWDATLDSRTRASHASADGKIKDNVTGMYSVFGGEYPGPRRTGIAKEDINCRCISVGEVGGLSPELRALQNEGMEPYQSFETWANKQGITANRFGEKYNFNGS
jgi:SPP1 gp7 family putative phage head morphogenesis protein